MQFPFEMAICLMCRQDIQRETGTCIIFDRHSHSFSVFGLSNKLDLAQSKFVLSLVALHKSKRLNVHLGGPTFAPDFIKEVVKKFGPRLGGLKERFPGLYFVLNTRHDTISVRGTKEVIQNIRDTVHEIVRSTSSNPGQTPYYSICLCEVEDGYRLEKCNHEFCRSCLVDQCESAIKSPGNNFPMRCAHEVCGELILVVDFKSLLSTHKVDELFRASLGSFVASSSGKYRFCPSPDCPSVYQVAGDWGSYETVCMWGMLRGDMYSMPLGVPSLVIV
ncbi:putative transcription factor C2H2 family [Helianthus annuus]|nr:putative transcription factor C2H2 family [Helianthus annuus]